MPLESSRFAVDAGAHDSPTGGEWDYEINATSPLGSPLVSVNDSHVIEGTAVDDVLDTGPSATEWTDTLSTVLKASTMGIIILVAVFGNLLVIASVILHRKLRVTTNYFVVSMAVADIAVALFAMSFNASLQITGRWLFGDVICDIWNSMDVFTSTVSILSLCCISFDRYYAIIHPFKHRIYVTKRAVAVILVVVWVAPVFMSFVPIFLGWYTTQEHLDYLSRNPDLCEFKVNKLYAVLSSSISFWIPCAIMLFTNIAIFRTANRQQKILQSRIGTAVLLSKIMRHEKRRGGGAEHPWPRARAGGSANEGDDDGRETDETKGVESIEMIPVRPKVVARSASPRTLTPQDVQAEDEQAPVQSQHHLAPPPSPEHRPHTTLHTTTTTTSSTRSSSQGVPGSSSPNPPGCSPSPPPPSTANHASRQHQPQHLAYHHNATPEMDRCTASNITKKERRGFITLAVVMVAFTLCWTPFFFFYMYSTLCGEAMCPTHPLVVEVLFWMGYGNSAVNPIIYGTFNRDFGQAFRSILQCAFCRK